MQRRNFINLIPTMGIAGSVIPLTGMNMKEERSVIADSRQYWFSVLTRIAYPLLNSLSNETLKKKMPVESTPGNIENRKEVTYLEAFGRIVAGISPWLELGEDNTTCPDFMNFTKGEQPLVDAAFLANYRKNLTLVRSEMRCRP